LERGRFSWPAGEGTDAAVSTQELTLLLDGVDCWAPRRMAQVEASTPIREPEFRILQPAAL